MVSQHQEDPSSHSSKAQGHWIHYEAGGPGSFHTLILVLQSWVREKGAETRNSQTSAQKDRYLQVNTSHTEKSVKPTNFVDSAI